MKRRIVTLKRARRIPPTRLHVVDLLGEAVSGVLTRPARTGLTMLGVLLAIATVVAILGLTSTASGQISQRFTVLAATEVDVQQPPAQADSVSAATTVFPDNADALADRIDGVRAAGVVQDISAVAGPATGVPLPGAGSEPLTVLAATPGFLPAIHAVVGAGRFFDPGHIARGDPVAVLGAAAASRLGVTRLDAQPVVFIGTVPLTVIGIISDVSRRPDVLSAIIVPRNTALVYWPQIDHSDSPAQPPEMIIDTDLGAAPVVAQQIAVALRPDNPSALTVIPPPDPHELHDSVQSDLSALLLLLAAVSLVIGMLGIANTTLVAVLERTAEIGLRRALGARKRQIAAQFVTESAIIGTMGGLVGAAVGVVVVVAVAIARKWTPIIDPVAVFPAPLVGTLVGVLAGLYPAARAASIPPAEAFRR